MKMEEGDHQKLKSDMVERLRNSSRFEDAGELVRVADNSLSFWFDSLDSHNPVIDLFDELRADFKLARRQVNTDAGSRSSSDTNKDLRLYCNKHADVSGIKVP
jgi:hypothetical protein